MCSWNVNLLTSTRVMLCQFTALSDNRGLTFTISLFLLWNQAFPSIRELLRQGERTTRAKTIETGLRQALSAWIEAEPIAKVNSDPNLYANSHLTHKKPGISYRLQNRLEKGEGTLFRINSSSCSWRQFRKASVLNVAQSPVQYWCFFKTKYNTKYMCFGQIMWKRLSWHVTRKWETLG